MGNVATESGDAPENCFLDNNQLKNLVEESPILDRHRGAIKFLLDHPAVDLNQNDVSFIIKNCIEYYKSGLTYTYENQEEREELIDLRIILGLNSFNSARGLKYKLVGISLSEKFKMGKVSIQKDTGFLSINPPKIVVNEFPGVDEKSLLGRLRNVLRSAKIDSNSDLGVLLNMVVNKSSLSEVFPLAICKSEEDEFILINRSRKKEETYGIDFIDNDDIEIINQVAYIFHPEAQLGSITELFLLLDSSIQDLIDNIKVTLELETGITIEDLQGKFEINRFVDRRQFENFLGQLSKSTLLGTIGKKDNILAGVIINFFQNIYSENPTKEERERYSEELGRLKENFPGFPIHKINQLPKFNNVENTIEERNEVPLKVVLGGLAFEDLTVNEIVEQIFITEDLGIDNKTKAKLEREKNEIMVIIKTMLNDNGNFQMVDKLIRSLSPNRVRRDTFNSEGRNRIVIARKINNIDNLVMDYDLLLGEFRINLAKEDNDLFGKYQAQQNKAEEDTQAYVSFDQRKDDLIMFDLALEEIVCGISTVHNRLQLNELWQTYQNDSSVQREVIKNLSNNLDSSRTIFVSNDVQIINSGIVSSKLFKYLVGEVKTNSTNFGAFTKIAKQVLNNQVELLSQESGQSYSILENTAFKTWETRDGNRIQIVQVAVLDKEGKPVENSIKVLTAITPGHKGE